MPLDAIISKIEERLDQLDVKPSSPQGITELLTRLDAKIREAQSKGYSAGEIVDLIVGCGLDVDASTLKKHLTETLDAKGRNSSTNRAKPRKVRKQKAD